MIGLRTLALVLGLTVGLCAQDSTSGELSAEPEVEPVVTTGGAEQGPPLDTPERRAAAVRALADELAALDPDVHRERTRVPKGGVVREPMPVSPEQASAQAAQRVAAWQAWLTEPGSEAAAIWAGRRLAYEGRYRDAQRAYDLGLTLHPQSFKLLRHRGHRSISQREFGLAVEDLSAALALTVGVADDWEPDGQPNAQGIPRSTHHSNIRYHLALAHYLRGEFGAAAGLWSESFDVARNDDMRVSSGWWAWLAARRAGAGWEQTAGRILDRIPEDPAELEILENDDYHLLLLMAKGLRSPEQLLGEGDDSIAGATRAYGVAAWLALQGENDRSQAQLESTVQGSAWAAFGFIAAEADLARLRASRPGTSPR